jgi:hypothetical protein
VGFEQHRDCRHGHKRQYGEPNAGFERTLNSRLESIESNLANALSGRRSTNSSAKPSSVRIREISCKEILESERARVPLQWFKLDVGSDEGPSGF